MMGLLFIIGASLLWALDTLIRYPLLGEGVSAQLIVTIEHIFLVMIFAPHLWRRKNKFLATSFKEWGAFFVVGGIGSALSLLAFTKAMSLMNPSLVILLQKLQPVFAIVLAWKILGEPISKSFIFWSLLSLVGAILIGHKELTVLMEVYRYPAMLGGADSLLGIGLTLFAVLGWGASTIYSKYLARLGHSELDLMGGRFLLGLLVLLPLLLTNLGDWQAVEVEHFGKILIMVMFSGLLAMYLYYQGLFRLPARLCTLAEMFFPFCAVVINWVFLGAKLDQWQLAGGLLLILSSSIIQWKRL